MTQITREEAIQVLVSALMTPTEQNQEPEKEKTPVSYPIMISIPEAAKRTGLSYDAIRKMCINNQIVHIRTGKKFLINWEKMVAYLDGVQNAVSN